MVKFIIAATGFQRKDARQLQSEIPPDRYLQVAATALRWELDGREKALAMLTEIVGSAELVKAMEAAQDQ